MFELGDRVRHIPTGRAGTVDHLGYQADLPLLHVRMDELDPALSETHKPIRNDKYEAWEKLPTQYPLSGVG